MDVKFGLKISNRFGKTVRKKSGFFYSHCRRYLLRSRKMSDFHYGMDGEYDEIA